MNTRQMRHDDEEQKNFFRAGNRIFCQNGQWFYQTREDTFGPFRDEAETQRELDRFVAEKEHFLRVRRAKEESAEADADIEQAKGNTKQATELTLVAIDDDPLPTSSVLSRKNPPAK